VKERPILFSGPMVRAILDGSKTQTRRVFKSGHESNFEEPSFGFDDLTKSWRIWESEYPEEGSIEINCPYGQVGDRLWVRETFYPTKQNDCGAIYRADAVMDDSGEREGYWVNDSFIPGSFTWTPSIHMPRWASRITLEITGVRVERLQEISQSDAEAEGVQSWMDSLKGQDFYDSDSNLGSYPATAFARMWSRIVPVDGDTSWSANPWVWVIEFKRVMP